MKLSSWNVLPIFQPYFLASAGPMIAPRMSAMKAAFSSGFTWYSGHIARYGSASTAKFGKKFFQSGSPPAALPIVPPNQLNFATRLMPGIAAMRGW